MEKRDESQSRPRASDVLPVPRSKSEAQRLYDRISIIYDYLEGGFERRYVETALDRLSVKTGESVLEIGSGTGYALRRIAARVGPAGRSYGLDLSSGMLAVTTKQLDKAGFKDAVGLCQGDAANLPYRASVFDAVFVSFTLDLFDTPEIPVVLDEVRRVLKPTGRLGAVSLSEEGGETISLRLYRWAHRRWPRYIDCRPIYLERSLRESGYRIRRREKVRFFGLTGEIVVAEA